ncbi:MAG: glycosyltransferase [Thermodesulforhabdaceae bacterium]
MRIVIDMQGAQSESRFRGIGRYTLSFAKAVVRHRGEHEVILALNGLFSDTIEPVRAAFDGLLPQENIRVWQAPGPVREREPGNHTRREMVEKIREAFIASFQPDVIHISSLFEGYVDDAVTSIKTFDPITPVSVTLHDLIPLLNPDHYLNPNPAYREYYLRKISHLKKADLLLGVSESSCREAIKYLDFDPARVVHVGEASGGNFRLIEIKPSDEKSLRDRLGLPKPFLMYLSAFDERKNHLRLIEAWARLPEYVRNQHQLTLVGVTPEHKARFEKYAQKLGLRQSDIVILSWLPDEQLLLLLNLCKAFVFPSWHEGFDLLVLKAMECGKAVIASNTSSLPEVVGREDALFDPFDVKSIASKIEQVLADEDFRKELERHALEQAKKFSWDTCAKRAWEAWESLLLRKTRIINVSKPRPRLAYVSPLPPERSGIADYSAELIPEISRFYEIDVVVAQREVQDDYIRANCSILSVEEFRKVAHSYDRVLYHFGNSVFHSHMFDLLEEIPGVVVLHDFFLSGIQAHRDVHGWSPHAWAKALYASHGYKAVCERYKVNDKAEVVWRYPANLPVLQAALGIIVHSEFSRTLARRWYGDEGVKDWVVIPLLRTPVENIDRDIARRALGFGSDDLLICSFGMLGPTKLNHRLLDAWLSSELAKDPKVHLVFVGENHGGDYGQQLLRKIAASSASDRIRITGWAEHEIYRLYLAAADIGVQLRALSRGETSGTVLDCMNYRLATVVNAHGSLAELDREAVWMLPDEFSDDDLIEALTTLARDADKRHALGMKAQEVIRTRHSPRRCSEQYYEAIEGFYQRAQVGLTGLVNHLAKQHISENDLVCVATSLASNFPPVPRRQLLVDVSALVQTDLKTGIERVTRAILHEWLNNPPEGFQVEPVYATIESQGYRCARRWTSRFLGIPEGWAEDTPVDVWEGDVFIGLDFHAHVVPAQQKFLREWHNRGVLISFIVHDLLPVTMPWVFPEGSGIAHRRWLETISEFDIVVCISRAVADEMASWVTSYGPKRYRPLFIYCSYHGADFQGSVPTTGMPLDAEQVLEKIRSRPSFLMVGTVEPRKGYLQTLAAFDQLWDENVDVNLVIVGNEGWKPLPDHMRRDIPETVNKLRTHSERGKRLFWLEGISDEYLEKVYSASTCLIAASYGEGFGLPLIEAAQHKLPIIARDIPVFREVAGEHAYYFENSKDPEVIADAVKFWLDLYKEDKHPKSDNMPWLTWKESASNLMNILLGKTAPYKLVQPDPFIGPGQELNFKSNKLRFSSWSTPEPDFRWSLGKQCSIYFIPGSYSFEGIVRCNFNTLGLQRIKLGLNKEVILDSEFNGIDLWFEARFSPDILCSGIENELLFELPDARMPDNGDKRVLGIALKKLIIV